MSEFSNYSNDLDIFGTLVCPTSLAIAQYLVSNEIKAYPNPIQDILNITFEKTITSVSIYNLLGQKIISRSVNANQTSIDVSNLLSGTYFVKVIADNQTRIVKTIKQ